MTVGKTHAQQKNCHYSGYNFESARRRWKTAHDFYGDSAMVYGPAVSLPIVRLTFKPAISPDAFISHYVAFHCSPQPRRECLPSPITSKRQKLKTQKVIYSLHYQKGDFYDFDYQFLSHAPHTKTNPTIPFIPKPRRAIKDSIPST